MVKNSTYCCFTMPEINSPCSLHLFLSAGTLTSPEPVTMHLGGSGLHLTLKWTYSD
jgi:hypothetical protein